MGYKAWLPVCRLSWFLLPQTASNIPNTAAAAVCKADRPIESSPNHMEGSKEIKGEDDVEVKKELPIEEKRKVELQVVLQVAVSKFLLTLYDVGEAQVCLSEPRLLTMTCLPVDLRVKESLRNILWEPEKICLKTLSM